MAIETTLNPDGTVSLKSGSVALMTLSPELVQIIASFASLDRAGGVKLVGRIDGDKSPSILAPSAPFRIQRKQVMTPPRQTFSFQRSI